MLGILVSSYGVDMPKKEKKAQNPEDVRIGKNLIALRGDMSQADLASKMRSLYGLQWSQATVWNIERGERPLRLSEAKAVASLLGANVEDLLQDENVNFKRALDSKLQEAVEQAEQSKRSGRAARISLKQLAVLLEQAKEGEQLTSEEIFRYYETATDIAQNLSTQHVSALRQWTLDTDGQSSKESNGEVHHKPLLIMRRKYPAILDES